MLRTILALCARDIGSERMYELLCQCLHEFIRRNTSWDHLLHEAEGQGIAPLLAKHVQALNLKMPKQVHRILSSLVLRSRQANSIRNEAVAEILRLSLEQEIDVVLAKGIALSNLVYSDPGLRPMRDIDLLIRDADTLKMKEILTGLGYTPEDRDDIPDDFYHLIPVAKIIEGLPVTIEVHRNLLPFHPQYPPWPLERSQSNTMAFTINTITASTLCLEDMLWHVYLHGFQSPLTYEPFRFIHVADIISLVEQRLDQIDWDKVRKIFPAVREVLSCFHCLTPWSEQVIHRLGLFVGGKHPDSPGMPYSGWPQRRLETVRWRDLPIFLRDTLMPGQWWVQVYYGQFGGLGILKARWIDHPLMLYRWAKAYGVHFLKNRRPKPEG
jgi:hypothetical protein